MWLTDCFWYDTQAAISRREKEITVSIGEEDTKNLDGETREEPSFQDGEGEEIHKHEAGRCSRSNKRTKVSASGTWREGEQTWPDEKYATVLKGGGSESYQPNSTSFSCETMDMDRQGLYYENHQNLPRKHTPTTKTTPTAILHETNSNTTTSTSFTIYEDPADDRTEEVYSFHHLSFSLPESWHSCPGDNKENADDDYYDEDEAETIIDDFQSFEGSEDMDHRQLFQSQHQGQSQNHIVNVDMNADRPDEAASNLLSVNTGLWNMDPDGQPREQRTRLSSREFANPVTIDINPSTNDSTSTAENQPRHHSPPETQHEEEILNPSAIERLASMTWLGAPPRRFLGRGRTRESGHGLGQRRLQRFLGV